ncbi:hypothetical protein L209DRAFT_764642 [Thermothelomyces heterothallicus CBS 203.75]
MDTAQLAPTQHQHHHQHAPTMNGVLPSPQYEYDREWRWPWWKFELMPDVLFTTLHERFNTRTCPIQSPHTFLFDVRACAEESHDIDTFYAKLAEKRDQRVAELEAAWEEVSDRMHSLLNRGPVCGFPGCKSMEMEDENPFSKSNNRFARSAAFCHLSRTMAFDCLINFFDGLVRDNREKDRRREEELKTPARILELTYESESIGAGQTPPADADDAFAGDPVRPTPPQPIRHALSPCLSPESTPSNEVDPPQIFPDQKDAGGENPPNPVPADDPTPVSSGRHNSVPLATEAAKQAAGAPQCDPPSTRRRPPGGLPSPSQRKRKRDGPGSNSGGGGATDTAVGDSEAQDTGTARGGKRGRTAQEERACRQVSDEADVPSS